MEQMSCVSVRAVPRRAGTQLRRMPEVRTPPASTGASQRLLVDGGFDGWYNGFNTDFSPIAPQVLPLQDVDDGSGGGGGGNAVPEPASMSLVLAGAVMLLSRRQRRAA